MSMEIAAAIIAALSGVGCCLLAIWSSRQDAHRIQQRRDMDAMAMHITEGATRLTRIESEMVHIPKTADVGRLYEKLNEISRDMAELSGSQKTLLAVFKTPTAALSGRTKQRTD